MKRIWLPEYMPDHYQKFLGIFISLIGFIAILHLTYKAFGKDESILQTAMLYLFLLTMTALVMTILHKILKSIKVSAKGVEANCYAEDDTQDVKKMGK